MPPFVNRLEVTFTRNTIELTESRVEFQKEWASKNQENDIGEVNA